MILKIFVYVIAILLLIAIFSTASAQPGMGNVKGQVTEESNFDDGLISLLTRKGEEVVVQAPEGFDFSPIEIGMYLHVKGRFNEDGEIVADWIKESKARGDDDEGGKGNSAFCSGRKDKLHPLAEGISDIYEISPEETMTYFCNGFGFGQIMLAIQTHKMGGPEVSVILENRRSGAGWGQMWKEEGFVAKPREASSPPGHLKRPDHAGPKEDKGQNEP